MTKRALILVEGFTEERFVKDVLAPEFVPLELYFAPTLLITKKVKDGPNFKGGVTTYQKFRNDAVRLLRTPADVLVTTLLDYYALPTDFPGVNDRPPGSPLQRVQHVEHAIHDDLGGSARFLPFLALHEFEAWLFSSHDQLPQTLSMMEKQPDFQAIRDAVDTPEDINDGPTTAPSKRIQELFPTYRKTLHGPPRNGSAWRGFEKSARTWRAGFARSKPSRSTSLRCVRSAFGKAISGEGVGRAYDRRSA